MKLYSSNEEFETKLKKSIDLVSNYVLKTYGPYGQNILIKSNGKSFLTKDGVTVAKSVASNDPVENSIIDIIKQVAEKTVSDVGDGTTTSILFFKKWMENIKVALDSFYELTPNKLKEAYDDILNKLFRQMEKNAKNISSKEDLRNIAYMASNGDKLISELISDVIDQIGVAGSISIKNSKTGRTYVQIVEGMKFRSNIASNVFLNDLQDKKVLNDCVVVISNVAIEFSEDLLHLLSDCVANKKSVLFICPSMDDKSLTTIIANVQRGALNCVVLSPNYLGIEKLEVLEDIALICGTTVNTTKFLNRTKVSQWGYCKNVEINKNTCTLTEANASPELLDNTLAALRRRLQEEESDIDQKRLDARISRLTSTLGVVHVGGQTEAEIIEKRHRVEDALESCHSAMRKGIIEGGGVGILKAYNDIKDQMPNDLSAHEKYIYQFVYNQIGKICSSISILLYDRKEFAKISNNRIEKILDLRSNKFVDAFEGGIIESVWTLQSALRNSFSAAWVLCQSYGAIVELDSQQV